MREGGETVNILTGTFSLVFSLSLFLLVAFKIYDIDQDGFISNGELFQVRVL